MGKSEYANFGSNLCLKQEMESLGNFWHSVDIVNFPQIFHVVQSAFISKLCQPLSPNHMH